MNRDYDDEPNSRDDMTDEELRNGGPDDVSDPGFDENSYWDEVCSEPDPPEEEEDFGDEEEGEEE